MMLVPEDEMLQRVQLQAYPAEAKSNVGIDQALATLLQSDTFPADVRAKLVAELTHRSSPVIQPQPVQQVPQSPVPLPEPPLHLGQDHTRSSVQNVLKSLPVSYQVRARQLLDLMNVHWNGDKEMLIGGRRVRNSNISELIKYAVKPAHVRVRQAAPTGWTAFRNQITTHQVPADIAPSATTKRHRLRVISDKRTANQPLGWANL
jgi:hypothetical protein